MTLQEEFLVDHVARVCHEANREFCRCLGDYSQLSWEIAEQWQRESAIRGVQFVLVQLRNGEAIGGDAQHEAWWRHKRETGWTFGAVKNAELKTHPCMRPYNELPASQRAKDTLFTAIAVALLGDAIQVRRTK